MALGEIGFNGLRMREEENEREEGAMEDDPDEYGNEIGGNIGSFSEIDGESAASVRSVALVRSVREKKWWAERRSSR